MGAIYLIAKPATYIKMKIPRITIIKYKIKLTMIFMKRLKLPLLQHGNFIGDFLL